MPQALRLGPDGIGQVTEFLRTARTSGVYDLALSGAHDLGYYVGDAEPPIGGELPEGARFIGPLPGAEPRWPIPSQAPEDADL